ncbi:MAG TPA: quinol:cytochrome C oxidoreductase [Ignavibacteria bacterium]|nr:quinol:cytochrome C oxidoreductase [Ignavibacteria bacterium]
MEYQKKELPDKVKNTGFLFAGIGLLLIAVSYILDPRREAFNNIIGLTFFASIAIGALALVALEYISGAVWSVPFRRVSEFIASSLPLVLVFAIPLFLMLGMLFHWTHPEVVSADKLLSGKSPYLNIPFFIGRTIGVILVLYVFYALFTRNSRKQDESKEQGLTRTNVKLSAAFMPVAGIGLTLLSIDWIMSLEPHWYSTIFGVYYISATLLAGLAATTYASVSLNEAGYLIPGVNKDHYYSLGALMFAITNFWAYIAFSQFLLIWYANIPEESIWFVMRWEGGWKYISILLIFVRFVIPYAGLLSQPSKSNPKRLKQISIFILIAHFFDLYWLIMPTFSKTVVFSFYELGFPLFVVGVVILAFYYQTKKHNLVAVGDPKLQRGLDFHL